MYAVSILNSEQTLHGHVKVHGVDEVIVRVVPGLVTWPEDIAEHREYVGVLGADVTHYTSGNEFPEK